MVKYIALWSMDPKLTSEEVWRIWPKHSDWVKDVLKPELKRYVQNRVIEKLTGAEIDFCGVTEMWFDDMESARKAVSRMIDGPKDDFLGKFIVRVHRVFVDEIEVPLG
jgi:hypothetical protein